MRKSLGDKRKHIPDEAIAEVTRLYHDAIELAETGGDKRVKVFDREAFGFARITVERPLRRVWQLTPEAVEEFAHHKAWIAWATPPKSHPDPIGYVHCVEADQARLREKLLMLTQLPAAAMEKEFVKQLAMALAVCVTPPPATVTKGIIAAAAVATEGASVITDRVGKPLPDSDLRDAENVALPPGWLSLGEDETKSLTESAEVHLAAEIHPYAPDAWIDHTKTKVGFEIPFARHFYVCVPPRPLAEIDGVCRRRKNGSANC
jgi:type I restriction enzyme M protein